MFKWLLRNAVRSPEAAAQQGNLMRDRIVAPGEWLYPEADAPLCQSA